MRRQEAGPTNAKYKPNPQADPGRYTASSTGGGFKRTGQQAGVMGSTDKAVAAKGFTNTDGSKEEISKKISDE